MQPEPILQSWHEFWLMAGTAAATLIGLLFVAVTLNADLILAGNRPHIKRIAEQAFQNYIVVLLAALFMLMPGTSHRMLATELTAISLIMTAWAVFRLVSALRISDESFSKARTRRRLLPSLLGYALMIAASAQMFAVMDADALRTLALSAILILISASGTSWDLLVRVAEIRHSA
jgi:membrane-bound acyltransferase YfiQ involved in biofilm formation